MYSEDKIAELLNNPGIIRNKLKVYATINNASRFMEVQQEFGSFDAYLWNYVDHMPIQNHWKHYKDCPATTDLSDTISKDLKKRGFKFTGSTVIYAFMQAIGMVNDHEISCFRYLELKK